MRIGIRSTLTTLGFNAALAVSSYASSVLAQAPPASPAPGVSAPAAQEKGTRPGRGLMASCRADVTSLCPTVPARGGGRFKCLRDNQAKLSPACSAAVSDRVQKQAERREARKSDNAAGRAACRADGRKFCKGTRGTARLQCLTENKAQIAPQCAQWVEQRSAQRAQRGEKKQ